MRYADLKTEEVQSLRIYPNLANDGDDVLASELDIESTLCLTLIKSQHHA